MKRVDLLWCLYRYIKFLWRFVYLNRQWVPFFVNVVSRSGYTMSYLLTLEVIDRRQISRHIVGVLRWIFQETDIVIIPFFYDPTTFITMFIRARMAQWVRKLDMGAVLCKCCIPQRIYYVLFINPWGYWPTEDYCFPPAELDFNHRSWSPWHNWHIFDSVIQHS
jgi:hypothetical protein